MTTPIRPMPIVPVHKRFAPIVWPVVTAGGHVLWLDLRGRLRVHYGPPFAHIRTTVRVQL